MELGRLRQAAEEAGWLVARGYPAAAVSPFVAAQRRLSGEEQALLACATRLRAQYAKHIARELEPDDVAKRAVRVDASSVLSAVAAAVAGRPLVQSPAGVIADPTWRRDAAEIEQLEASFSRVQGALARLRPASVRWYVEESASWTQPLEELIRSCELRRARVELLRVPDVAVVLREAAYVASSDPEILDQCACWSNIVLLALGELEPELIRLDD